MSLLPDDVRREFGRECYSYVKGTPRGFDVDDDVVEELAGKVVKAMVIRKRFEDGALVCDSRALQKVVERSRLALRHVQLTFVLNRV